MPVDYIIDGEKVGWPNGPVLYHARFIRKERDKEHAEVTIARDGVILDSDDINLKNREERNRLANSCHKMLPDSDRATYKQDQMQHDLLLFCRDLYRTYMQSSGAVRTKGDVNPTEPVFLLQDYILAEAGTILFAPPGRGKSWTGLLWGVSVDAGLSHPWQTLQVPVLFLNLERSEASFARRLGMVNEALGLPRDRHLLMMHERGKSLADIWDAAETTIQREGVGLTVIDSLSRSGVGSLVKDDTANKAMDYANAFKSAWLFLAHTPRGDESHTFGSQMFDAAADLAVQLLTEESDAMDDPMGEPRLGIGIKVTKANDTAKPPLRIWTYEFDRRFGLNKVRLAQPGEWGGIEGEAPVRPLTNWGSIEQQFRMRGPMSQTRLANDLSMNKGTVADEIKRAVAAGRAVQVAKVGKEILFDLPKLGVNVESTVGDRDHSPLGGNVQGQPPNHPVQDDTEEWA